MALKQLLANSYTVRDYFGDAGQAVDTIKRIIGMGYDGIEIAYEQLIDPVRMKAIGDEHHFEYKVIAADFDFLTSGKDVFFAMCRAMGSVYACIGAMPERYQGNHKGYAAFTAELNRLGRELKDGGVTLLYHLHDFEFTKEDGRIGADLIAESVDPQAALLLPDTYWIQAGGGTPSEWIKKLKSVTKSVHFKDYGLESHMKPKFMEVGEGNLNWTEILAACEVSGVEWAAVEQDFCAGNPFHSLEISIKNLERMGCRSR